MTAGAFDGDDLPVAVVVVEAGRVTSVNRAAADLFGDPSVDLPGRTLVELVGDEAAGVLADVGGELAVTTRLPVGRGQLVEVRARRDTTGRLVLALRDVEDEAMANVVLDRLADSTLVLDTDGRVVWQSRALRLRVPGESEDGLGLQPMERVHPEDLPAVLEAFAHAVEHPGQRQRFEVRARAPDDDDHWQPIEVSGVGATDDPVVRGVVLQVRDLGQGAVLPSLAEAGSGYASLAEAAPIGIVVDDLRGTTVYRNPAARRLLGQHALHDDATWWVLARGDYQPALEAMLRAARERGAHSNAVVPFETGGRQRWLRLHTVPQLGVDGELEGRPTATGIITTLEDVTAEIEARAETDRLTQMLDATSDLVAVFRPNGEILYANRVTRAALAELQAAGAPGRLRDLLVPEARQAVLEDLILTLATEDEWRSEVVVQLGAGRRTPISAVAVARRDADGEIDWVAMLGRDISERKDAEERLRHLATRDPLTGLANRLLANDRLAQAVARQRRAGEGLAVLFCDLDGLKDINDTHGHAAGDRVLVEVAARLTGITREVDTVARVGGDEFVVVCEGLTDREQLADLADRIVDAVALPVLLDASRRVQPSISIGVAVADAGVVDVDVDRLLTVADTAMYRAKARGGSGARIVTVGQRPTAAPQLPNEGR